MKVKHWRSTPLSFNPPFRAHVTETYCLKALGEEKSLKERVDSYFQKSHPFIKGGLSLRNKLVKKFGFKTDFSGGEYGPFKVDFPSDKKMTAQYEDPHFSFFGEMTNNPEEGQLVAHLAVRYKTPQGMIYFWSIYLGHVQVFKSFFKELHKL